MDIRVEVTGWGCIALAMLCLVLPLDWVAAAVMAAAVHEGCHVLAVFLLGGKIRSFRIGLKGSQLLSSPMQIWQDLAAILAGPAGSMSLLLLGRIFPQLALCGLAQGLFNLLPVFPLDGGRALMLFCHWLFPREWGRRICNAGSGLALLLILAAGCWGTILKKLGPAPLILATVMVFDLLKAKISCKEGILRVQ